MVARTRTYRDLSVMFHRDGEPPEIQVARDGSRALKIALLMLARLDELLPGDRLSVAEGED